MRAVKETMAAQWRPDVNFSVTLHSTQRRLQGVPHRRLAGNVIADFTTMVFEPEAAAMVSTMTNLDVSLMTASLSKTLTTEGLSQWADATVMSLTATYTPAEEASSARGFSLGCLAHVAVIASALRAEW